MQTSEEKELPFLKVSRNVLVVSLVSFFQDLSSETIYPLLPFFYASTLGINKAVIGSIEGIAESTASILKVFSGLISDRLGRRKSVVFVGYFLSALSKPFLALAVFWQQALAIRFGDRVGKGIRGAPRDALIADSTPYQQRGRAFGFHRAADTLGAVGGPLIAFLLWPVVSGNYRKVFLFAAIPAVISVVLIFLIKEVKRKSKKAQQTEPSVTFPPKVLNRKFKIMVIAVTLFALGNSSDIFVLLRAGKLGIAVPYVFLAYALFNLTYSFIALPAGILSDRIGRRAVLILSYLIFAGAYVGFASVRRVYLVWLLFIIYGFYRGMADVAERALAVDLAPEEKRATALGFYQTCVGIALLPASMIGGALWHFITPAATFYYGAATAFVSAILILFI